MDRCGACSTPNHHSGDNRQVILFEVKLFILSEGREKADPAASMVADYVRRIQNFVFVEDIVARRGAKVGLVEKIRQFQSKGSFLVALDERGKQYTSVAFSSQLKKWVRQAPSSITFVIGGAEGLPKEVKAITNATIALSQMTLPHRFARLILAEQIYRAYCIEKNIPYHK